MTEAADLHRIRAVLEVHGYRSDESYARELWILYSCSAAAIWLSLPDTDDDLLEDLRSVMEYAARA